MAERIPVWMDAKQLKPFASTDTLPSSNVTLNGGGSLLYANTTIPAGNTLTSTSETAFASTYTLQANALHAGDTIIIRMAGTYGGTVLPTIRAKVKFGSTVLFDTGALTGLVTGAGLPWFAEGRIIVQSIGASGSMEPNGSLQFSTAATAALSVLLATGATALDTTAAQAITVTGHLRAFLKKRPALGYHYYAALEIGHGSGTQTWYGDGGVATKFRSGIAGTWEC